MINKRECDDAFEKDKIQFNDIFLMISNELTFIFISFSILTLN